MSTAIDPSPQDYVRPPINGLGIAGFVVSFVGILGACAGAAVLSPVGLTLSAVAVRRPPRAFAIAGLVLGVVGSILLAVVVLFTGGVELSALRGYSERDRKAQMQVVMNVGPFYSANRRLPVSLNELAAQYPDTPLQDQDGNALGYSVISPTSCMVTWPGPDGVLGTRDDRDSLVSTVR